MYDIIAIIFDDENNLEVPAIRSLAADSPFAMAYFFRPGWNRMVNHEFRFFREDAMPGYVVLVPFIRAIGVIHARTCGFGISDRNSYSPSVSNSLSLFAICAFSRMMIDECICDTRLSERSSVAPISFMVISS